MGVPQTRRPQLVKEEELAVVSRTLGHADVSTTAHVHVHLTPSMLDRAAARMDRILSYRSAASGSCWARCWALGKQRGLRNAPEASFVLS